jgi:hypothetical protein
MRGGESATSMLAYAYTGMTLVLILLLIHIVTTLYEHYENSAQPKVAPCQQLSERAAKCKVISKTERDFAKMRIQIEQKFAKSTMNKTFTFPRKDE